jgi:tetratricopeptide (TPR) repeat protein
MGTSSETRFQHALAVARAGNAVEARALLEEALRQDRRHAGIRNALAVLRLEAGEVDAAVVLLEGLNKELPNVAAIRLNFGNALVAAGQVERAIGTLERAVRLAPNDPACWYGLGRAQQTVGDPTAAVRSYREVLERLPDHREARASLAAAYNFLDDYTGGEREARQVLHTAPEDAGARVNLAVALLSTGQWSEGWHCYEARSQTTLLDGQRRHWPAPRWEGYGAKGDRILVHAEQGFGDVIQFSRYLPRLRARGFHATLMCPRAMVDLFLPSGLADEVVAIGDPMPAHAWQIPLTSLPHALALDSDVAVTGTGLPYLHAPQLGTAVQLPTVTHSCARVGIAWAGSPTHVNDRHRSCRLGDLSALLDMPGVEWVNLQLGTDGDAVLPCPRSLDARPLLTSFGATAAVLSQLDAVVCVDSAVAHLAGALGVPCLLLLPRIGLDWRWAAPCHRDWYRSVIPIRQGESWASIMGDVRRLIETRVWTPTS